MTQAAAVILGLSLIVAGIGLVGDALGAWKIPGDFWAVVIVLLGAAGRYASSALGKGNDDDDNDGGGKPNGKRIAPVAVVLMLCAGGCSGPLAKSNAEAWARCTGGGALTCVPAAQGDAAEAAINFAACVSAQAIRCTAPLVAQQNPPLNRSSPVDGACVAERARQCSQTARSEAPPSTRHLAQICVEAAVRPCWND